MKARSLFALVLGLLLVAVPVEARQPVPNKGLDRPYGKVRVLCVGWNEYGSCRRSGYGDLRFAEKDAGDFKSLMEQRFGYTAELLDPKAGRAGLLARLQELQKTLQPEDVFIFFIAAHGATIDTPVMVNAGGNTGYIVPPDAGLDKVLDEKTAEVRAERERRLKEFREAHPDAKSDEDLQKAGLPDSASLDPKKIEEEAARRVRSFSVFEQQCLRTSTLRDQIDKLPAKHVVMLFDACFSGFAVLTSRSVNGADPDDLGRYRFLTDPSREVITAGTAGQETYESEAWGGGHGLFSAELLRVLGETPNALSVAEVHSKVQASVTSRAAESGKKLVPLRHSLPIAKGGTSGQFVFVPPDQKKWLQGVGELIQSKHGGNLKVAMRSAQSSYSEKAKYRTRDATLQLLAAMMYDARVRAGKIKHDPATTAASPRWTAWFKAVEPLAASGQPESLAALYYAYARGLGVARNQEEAVRFAQEARNTGDPVGKAVLAAALSGGELGNQEQLVSEELRKSATAGESALGGAAVMAAAASSQNGPALIVGAGFGLIGVLEVFHDTVGKAMADTVRLRDDALLLLEQAPGADRTEKLERTLNEWLTAGQAVADHANRHAASDFTKMASQIVVRFNTRVRRVKECMSSDLAKAKAEFDLADEAVDQLYGLYFLCIEKPERDQKARAGSR